jgi:hypothetical protein
VSIGRCLTVFFGRLVRSRPAAFESSKRLGAMSIRSERWIAGGGAGGGLVAVVADAVAVGAVSLHVVLVALSDGRVGPLWQANQVDDDEALGNRLLPGRHVVPPDRSIGLMGS